VPTAVLSYPPEMRRALSDSDAVSAARVGRGGAYLLYLNATPWQGGENLRNWAVYRLRVLRAEDASWAREDTAATGLAFLGGTGSCVIDDYLTDRGASLPGTGLPGKRAVRRSVIVAAAPAARWARARPLLERAVAAYCVR